MAVLSRICWRALQRRPVLETVTQSPPGPQLEPMLAQEIASGQLSPEDVFIEDLPETNLPESRDKKPWIDIRTLWKSGRERAERIGLKVTRKKPLRSQWEGNQLHNVVVPPSPPVNVDPRKKDPLGQKKIIDNENGNLVAPDDKPTPLLLDTIPESAKGQANTGVSNTGTVRPAFEVLLMDGEENESAEAGQSVLNPFMSDSSIEATAIREGSNGEVILETQFAIASETGQSDLNLNSEGKPGFAFPCTPQDTEWISSAVAIKDGQGVEQPEKLFYDTGSVANLSTSEFALAHNLKLRPILPEHLVEYNTPNGSLIPMEYFEMELKDPKRGIKDFVKVRFVVVKWLVGMGLVLGSTFMKEYGIVLDPTKGRDMYTVTAREAGQAAKEDQKRYYAQVAKATERAQGYIAASTAGPTTTTSGTSQGGKYAGSSRTSASSSGKPK